VLTQGRRQRLGGPSSERDPRRVAQNEIEAVVAAQLAKVDARALQRLRYQRRAQRVGLPKMLACVGQAQCLVAREQP
jgi:hypothetical protein